MSTAAGPRLRDGAAGAAAGPGIHGGTVIAPRPRMKPAEKRDPLDAPQHDPRGFPISYPSLPAISSARFSWPSNILSPVASRLFNRGFLAWGMSLVSRARSIV